MNKRLKQLLNSPLDTNSASQLIAYAWHIGTPETKGKLEKEFPDLFGDNDTKWRSSEEMATAAEGYYWADGEQIVELDRSIGSMWVYICGAEDSRSLSHWDRYYGPIEPPPADVPADAPST